MKFRVIKPTLQALTKEWLSVKPNIDKHKKSAQDFERF